MTTTIVIAGKGGTGKTSISALLVQILSKKGVVLAIDADPATNLNQALGVEAGRTVGGIREEMTRDILSGTLSPSVSKHDYLEGQIRAALVESKGFDLLAIGRPEGWQSGFRSDPPAPGRCGRSSAHIRSASRRRASTALRS